MINTKYIEDRLKEYKEKESIIETTLARIEAYQEAINNPDSFQYVLQGQQREVGGSRSISGFSSVEIAVRDKEEAEELLKEWIKEDKSRIYPLQIEREQINGALNALKKEQKFIIERKYFDGMFWDEIEIIFNPKFRKGNEITESGLKKINRKALDIIIKILEPYYSRLK